MEVYDGPLAEVENFVMYYSDSAKMVLRLTAPKQNEMQNGDKIFPDGMHVVFYENEKETSTIDSKYGILSKETGIYTLRDDVVVINKTEGKKINSEELNWEHEKKRIFTDKFVKIETPTEILMGNGLEANEDFSRYRILKPTGTFTINQ
jgi:LPS export ABC transporter protein LptC